MQPDEWLSNDFRSEKSYEDVPIHGNYLMGFHGCGCIVNHWKFKQLMQVVKHFVLFGDSSCTN